MSVRIRKIDRGYEKLRETLARMKSGPGVSVGIHAREGAEAHRQRLGERGSPLTVVAVGAIQEFGLGVPERSWLRAWFDASKKDNLDALRRAFQLVLKGRKTVEEALDLLGLRFVGAIQKRIAQGVPPPNAPATIAAKGSSTPLIDEGQLRQGITHLTHVSRR